MAHQHEKFPEVPPDLDRRLYKLLRALRYPQSHLDIPSADLGKGTSAPSSVVVGNFTGWQFTIGDDAVVDVVIPHDLEATQRFTLDIVWVINEAYATNSGEVQWQIDWSIIPDDGSETVTAPTRTGTKKTGDINIPAVAYRVVHTQIELNGADLDLDDTDILGVTISRVAIDGGNNPIAHPVIIEAHFEYNQGQP